MRPAIHYFWLCGFFLSAALAQAQTTTYTSKSSFLAALQPGYYLETFDEYDADGPDGGLEPSPQAFAGNGFAYTLDDQDTDITYSSSSFNGFVAATTYSPPETLTLTFTSGNVTAVGGTIFATDSNYNPVVDTLTATLDSGAVVDLTSNAAYASEPFAGFTTSDPISSLTISAPANFNYGDYSTLDNLYVGSAAAAPEPAVWTPLAAACAALCILFRGRRSSRAIAL